MPPIHHAGITIFAMGKQFTPAKKAIRGHQSIQTFFSCFSLPLARKYLLSAVKAAESKSVWNLNAPTDLLSFFGELECLLHGAYQLTKTGQASRLARLDRNNVPDLFLTHQYCGTLDTKQPWENMPRNISAAEYRDPYKALQKLGAYCSKKEWQETLNYILNYALGRSSINELGLGLELVQVTELLLKMIDACHLIHVRMNAREPSSALK
jgi:hypothetical protein